MCGRTDSAERRPPTAMLRPVRRLRAAGSTARRSALTTGSRRRRTRASPCPAAAQLSRRNCWPRNHDRSGSAWNEDRSYVGFRRPRLRASRTATSWGRSRMGHDSIVPLFCPDASNDIRKIRISACLEWRCSTADLLDAAMVYRTDIVPFRSRVSTVHGVVFDFFARELADPCTAGR